MTFSVNNLTLSIGKQNILNEISLSLNKGDFCLLLGANGSGKTTLLRACCKLERFQTGSITLNNSPLCDRDIGFVSHSTFLYNHLTVFENIKLYSRLYQCEFPDLKSWHIDSLKKKKISELSQGQKALISLCRATMHAPKVLFLDEPTSALDNNTVQTFKHQLEKLSDQYILCASHDLSRVTPMANRAILIKEGTIIKDSNDVNDVILAYQTINR